MLQGRYKTLLDSLSRREREVANHFASGLTYKSIAESLSLSPATIRNHLNNIYSKLRIGNKAELVAVLMSDRNWACPAAN
jgi:DNA-binding CsgD family transcriptional regulator